MSSEELNYMEQISRHADWPGESKAFLRFLLRSYEENKINGYKALNAFFDFVPEFREIEKDKAVRRPNKVGFFLENKERILEEESNFSDYIFPKQIFIKNAREKSFLIRSVIKGKYEYDQGASSLSFLGDVDGDGYRDYAIGVSSAFAEGRESGVVYIVFGHSGNASEIDLSSSENKDRMIVIIGANQYDALG